MEKDINCLIKVVAEKRHIGKWLADTIGKDFATISEWCINSAQLSLVALLEIANVLEVDVKEIVNSSKEDVMYIQVVK